MLDTAYKMPKTAVKLVKTVMISSGSVQGIVENMLFVNCWFLAVGFWREKPKYDVYKEIIVTINKKQYLVKNWSREC